MEWRVGSTSSCFLPLLHYIWRSYDHELRWAQIQQDSSCLVKNCNCSATFGLSGASFPKSQGCVCETVCWRGWRHWKGVNHPCEKRKTYIQKRSKGPFLCFPQKFGEYSVTGLLKRLLSIQFRQTLIWATASPVFVVVFIVLRWPRAFLKSNIPHLRLMPH